MKFPAICTLISTGKLVVCQDAGSFSNKSLVYGWPMSEEPVAAPIFDTNESQPEAEESVVTEDEARFQELKAQKAYLVSKPQEVRDEYNALKLKLGK